MRMTDSIESTIKTLFDQIFNLETVATIILVAVCVITFNRLISVVAGFVIRMIVNTSEAVDSAEKQLRYRRAETSLGVLLAFVKIAVIVIGVFVLWRLLLPNQAPAAAVGASALFIVLSGATVVPLLRDITAGIVMAAERWYGVGDYVTIEPFVDAKGVVEQIGLRSTKIRGLSGEVIWVHNQHIQAVKVKYRGTTNIALDVFVKDREKAHKILDSIIDVVPTGATMVVGGLHITEEEKLNDSMWRITVSGQTIPGREWLIENFAAEAIKDANELEAKKVIIYGPIARYVDSSAEKRFKRAIKPQVQPKEKRPLFKRKKP